MDNGDVLLIDGQRYMLVGVEPGGVKPRLAYLEHTTTGARAFREWEEISEDMVVPRLRLIHSDRNQRPDPSLT